jgi:hypothetical protein
MKITALKTGRFAHPVVSEPQIKIESGKEYDVDTQIGCALVDCGWAEEVKKDMYVFTQAPEKPAPKKEAPKPARKKKVKKDK